MESRRGDGDARMYCLCITTAREPPRAAVTAIKHCRHQAAGGHPIPHRCAAVPDGHAVASVPVQKHADGQREHRATVAPQTAYCLPTPIWIRPVRPTIQQRPGPPLDRAPCTPDLDRDRAVHLPSNALRHPFQTSLGACTAADYQQTGAP